MSFLSSLTAGRCPRARPAVFAGYLDVDQQIGERRARALPGDRGGESEASSFSTRLTMRSSEMAEGIGVAARKLDLLDLVGERFDQRFQSRRHHGAAFARSLQRIGQRTMRCSR